MTTQQIDMYICLGCFLACGLLVLALVVTQCHLQSLRRRYIALIKAKNRRIDDLVGDVAESKVVFKGRITELEGELSKAARYTEQLQSRYDGVVALAKRQDAARAEDAEAIAAHEKDIVQLYTALTNDYDNWLDAREAVGELGEKLTAGQKLVKDAICAYLKTTPELSDHFTEEVRKETND